MSGAFPLEEFPDKPVPVKRADPDGPQSPQGDSEEIETLKVSAYDSGYKAGWDDAAAAQASEQNQIGAELAKNLQDFSFTFHEARVQVMKSMQPLLLEIVGKILPEMALQSVGHRVIEELMPLAEAAIDVPIEIVIAPSNRPALEHILSAATSVPVSLAEEPTLGDGQALLRAGQAETHINLDETLARITSAIQSVYQVNAKEFDHG